ncbi:hypothetical protein JTE90_004921 [Oedothorax gibbosus]|uniref:Uncharacterized protein n=1 Tax=Oedothorax gibbosus TaxID=931172 RepID=A0AAV6UMI7_9ARAC|nr:hypothetical protein JTE90_004921 [Oedothorax gibbosus]
MPLVWVVIAPRLPRLYYFSAQSSKRTMPLMQQILLAIRTLTEDEPPQQFRRKRHGRHRSDSKRQQAVNLVFTFRELFASGGFNFLVEDDPLNRSLNKLNRHNHSHRRESIGNTPNSDACQLEYTKICVVDLPQKGNDLSELDTLNTETIPKEHMSLSSTELTMPVPICSNLVPEVRNRELDIRIKRNSNADSWAGTRELIVFDTGTDKKRRQPVTVPLSSDDENKTVATLRKVLKWSPTKQNLATFAVSVPKEEEHKAVAVMQNAVNRVKEEQLKKKKRRLFKLTFC